MATPIPSNAASFTLGELAAACGGRLQGGAPDVTVRGVCTDSRQVQPGGLYVALRGEHHDGHAFLAGAQAAGAAAALVSDEADAPAGLPLVVARDTRRALGDVARAHRRRWGGRVAAITGSAGKTTTKELSTVALAGLGHRVHATRGNLNNDVGLPMTLLGLTGEHDVAVVEIGTSGPGEIARLTEICEPDVGVVTTVALAHVERLSSLEAVADEKCALLRALPAAGVAIYGCDSALLEARRGTFSAGRVLSFGEAEGADLRLTACAPTSALLSRCELWIAGRGEPLELQLKLFGRGPALDAAAALGVALAWHDVAELPLVAAALARVEPPPGRMRPCKGQRGSLILDDTYNANPASVRSSVAALRELAIARGGRAIAVLGDMAELGDHAQAEHERVGRELVEAGVAEAYLCGPLMETTAKVARDEVRRRRAKGPHVVHCADARASVPDLMRTLSARDVVLVKGSRSMAMERVVDALRTGPGEPA